MGGHWEQNPTRQCNFAKRESTHYKSRQVKSVNHWRL
jgi:hypothetical protein